MLLEEIKPPVFNTKPAIQKLANQHGIPSKEVLDALHQGKKGKPEYEVVKKAKV